AWFELQAGLLLENAHHIGQRKWLAKHVLGSQGQELSVAVFAAVAAHERAFERWFDLGQKGKCLGPVYIRHNDIQQGERNILGVLLKQRSRLGTGLSLVDLKVVELEDSSD